MSYREKGKSIMENYFTPDVIKTYPEVTATIELGNELISTIKNIIKFRFDGNAIALQNERNKLALNDLVNLIIFDIQTTGLPEIIENKVSYPAITQFCFYHPKTGRNFSKYVKPHKPITFQAAENTGLYNSFSLFFELPIYPESCDPKSLNSLLYLKYFNYSLLENSNIKDQISDIKEMEKGLSENEINELAIQSFLETMEPYPIKSLEEESPFHDLVDEIFEFVERGIKYDEFGNQISKTIFISHNASKWSEPILNAELERICCKDKIEGVIFLDSKDLFLSILEEAIEKRDSNPNLVQGINLNEETIIKVKQRLGENRVSSFNSIVDAVDLWSAIQFCSMKLYGKQEWEFIVSKIIEELYSKTKL